MGKESFYTALIEEFGMSPSSDQLELFSVLEKFVRTREGKQLLIVKGYAGTGKTSVLASFVRTLANFKVKTKLLAPTGRAAKVFSNKANQEALTIHKHIYRRKSKVDISSGMERQKNLFKNTVFFVDEASMIGDYTLTRDGGINARNLLEDLIEYVYSVDNCKLILIGDDGQLPPVGSDFSPALNLEYMKNHYSNLNISHYKLTSVIRQSNDSEILRNATLLRNTEWGSYPKFELVRNSDLKRINGLELQEELEKSYSEDGMSETMIVTRSNKQANLYNQHIRGRILWYEEQLCSGDQLMVVKNNYYWLEDDSKMGFIANGEMMRVIRVKKTEEVHGFEFVHLIVTFIDYEDLGQIEVIAFSESLLVEAPSLPRDRMKELFYSVERDYAHLRDKKKRYEAILNDPYFNALQIKYAYAITCHKSQGGQWKNVFIDQGYLTEEMMGKEYYRWMYTALTRASNTCYLVNFADDFFINPEA